MRQHFSLRILLDSLKWQGPCHLDEESTPAVDSRSKYILKVLKNFSPLPARYACDAWIAAAASASAAAEYSALMTNTQGKPEKGESRD